MAAAAPPGSKPSWNPLVCGGTGMPAPLLLMAKLVVLGLLLTGHLWPLPDRFAPYLLRGICLLCAGALLFNRRVRLSSILLGGCMFLAMRMARDYYSLDEAAAAALLALAGLSPGQGQPWLVRLPVAALYFAAGSGKLFEADWQLAAFLEMFLCAGLLIPRTRHLAVWLSVLFQCWQLLFGGQTLAMFFVMQASMLAFVPWPREAVAIYDGGCGFCERSRRWMEWIDRERLIHWAPWQSGIGARWNIDTADLMRRMYVVLDGSHVASGFRAWKLMLLANPLTHFLLALLTAAPPASWTQWRAAVAVTALAFFFPPFNFIGEAAYNYVARNRHRIGAQSACAVDVNRS
jgi:predicted DCC family thiol-disulfide oxidoreductase YuxK